MNWISLLGLEAIAAKWRANVIEGAIAAEDRLTLAQLEWREQKHRLRNLGIFTLIFAGLTIVTLVVLSFAVIVHFWDTPQRNMVAWVVAGVWMVSWVGVLLTLLSIVRQAGKGFALTRHEIVRDWQSIKERL